MNHSIYTRSAEVVFAESRAQKSECMEKCLKRLTARERALLMNVVPWPDVKATAGISTVQTKKNLAKLRKCLQKCLEEEEQALSQTD